MNENLKFSNLTVVLMKISSEVEKCEVVMLGKGAQASFECVTDGMALLYNALKKEKCLLVGARSHGPRCLLEIGGHRNPPCRVN